MAVLSFFFTDYCSSGVLGAKDCLVFPWRCPDYVPNILWRHHVFLNDDFSIPLTKTVCFSHDGVQTVLSKDFAEKLCLSLIIIAYFAKALVIFDWSEWSYKSPLPHRSAKAELRVCY